MKFYEINREIERLLMQVDEDGEISEEVFQKILELEMAKEEKAESIGIWIKSLRAEADAIKQEKLELGKRQKQKNNKADSLERFLADMLDGQKVETAKVSISWRKSTAVVIDEAEAIPKIFRIPQPDKIDKLQLKKAINGGAHIDGAHLEHRDNIQIK